MSADLYSLIARVTAPLRRRLASMVLRGVVALVDDTGQMQVVQASALFEEVQDGVEHWQSYGHGSVPLAGAEILLLAVGGDRSHTVAICVADPRYRPTGLAAGDSYLHDHRGQIVRLTSAGVEIIPVSQVIIGSGADAPVLASALATALGSVTPVPNDGGAAVLAGIIAALNSGSASATKLKAE